MTSVTVSLLQQRFDKVVRRRRFWKSIHKFSVTNRHHNKIMLRKWQVWKTCHAKKIKKKSARDKKGAFTETMASGCWISHISNAFVSLPSTLRYAEQDMPLISMVYFPESSTLGPRMVSWYRSFSFLNLYLLPWKISCEKRNNEITRSVSCERVFFGNKTKKFGVLTSLRTNHLGLQLGFEKMASKVTFLSLPSFAYWSTSGFRKLSCFCNQEWTQWEYRKDENEPWNLRTSHDVFFSVRNMKNLYDTKSLANKPETS